MKQELFTHLTTLLLAGALLVSCAPMMSAQIGRQNGASNLPDDLSRSGVPVGSSQTAQSSSKKRTERDFLSNIVRDSNSETTLSEIAIQQSSNDQLKKFAQQMISDNQRVSHELYNGSLGNICPVISKTPARVHEIAKGMKTLSGVQFDGTYLSQLEAYIRHDQQMIQDSPKFSNFSDMEATVSQMRLLTDHRIVQIGKLADSDNIELR